MLRTSRMGARIDFAGPNQLVPFRAVHLDPRGRSRQGGADGRFVQRLQPLDRSGEMLGIAAHDGETPAHATRRVRARTAGGCGRLPRPREALHGGEQLLGLACASCSSPDASAPATQWRTCSSRILKRERLERGVDGRDLREDVDAVAVVLDHPLDPAHLALDPVQALDERVLVLRVAVARARLQCRSCAPSRGAAEAAQAQAVGDDEEARARPSRRRR